MKKPSTSRVQKRVEKYKERVLENLRKIPVVNIACKRSGIGRSTYYRWIKEDAKFEDNAKEAIEEGINVISDLSEAKLIQLINEGRMPAITMWLRHNNPRYKIQRFGELPPKENLPTPADLVRQIEERNTKIRGEDKEEKEYHKPNMKESLEKLKKYLPNN